jgi:hypothetical protein
MRCHRFDAIRRCRLLRQLPYQTSEVDLMPTMIETAVYDVVIDDCGSVVVLTALTDAGRKWIDSNLLVESWQWIGCSLAVDPCYTLDLIDAMVDAGLDVGSEERQTIR